jgi:hypothetical protein
MSHYDLATREEIEYLNEVLNLLEVNNFLPPKLLARAKNRVHINHLKRIIAEEKNIEVREQMQETLKKSLEIEIKCQKEFSKFNKEKFLVRLIRKLSGK